MSEPRSCWVCWMNNGGDPQTEPGDIYCEHHGHLAVEYEQDGHRWVTGGLSRVWLESDVLQSMKEHRCTILRVFDAVAEAQDRFPPGSRVMSLSVHPALRGWLGTVAGEYRAAITSGADVLIDWDGGHASVRRWGADGLELISRPRGQRHRARAAPRAAAPGHRAAAARAADDDPVAAGDPPADGSAVPGRGGAGLQRARAAAKLPLARNRAR